MPGFAPHARQLAYRMKTSQQPMRLPLTRRWPQRLAGGWSRSEGPYDVLGRTQHVVVPQLLCLLNLAGQQVPGALASILNVSV